MSAADRTPTLATRIDGTVSVFQGDTLAVQTLVHGPMLGRTTPRRPGSDRTAPR